MIRPGKYIRPKGGLNSPFAINGNFEVESSDNFRGMKRNASTENRISANLVEIERPKRITNEHNYNNSMINERDLYNNNKNYEADIIQYKNQDNGIRTPRFFLL